MSWYVGCRVSKQMNVEMLVLAHGFVWAPH